MVPKNEAWSAGRVPESDVWCKGWLPGSPDWNAGISAGEYIYIWIDR